MKPMARDTRGATTLEFALVSTLLMAMIFGSIELGLMMWTRGTLQAIAAQTARCAAISSTNCNNSATTPPTTPQTYAAAQATALLGAGLITSSDVSVTSVSVPPTAGCLSTSPGTATFEVVTITVTPWVGVSASGKFGSYSPLGPATETVTACYPT
jgi:Flp pilus assembly protein TadG